MAQYTADPAACTPVAAPACSLKNCRMQVVQRTLNWMDRVAGAMFLGFGLKLAMSDNSAH